MLNLLIIWLALIVVLLGLAIGRPREGGALAVAYFFGLSLIHVPGALRAPLWCRLLRAATRGYPR